MTIQTSLWPRLAPFLFYMLMLALNAPVISILNQFNIHENFSYMLRILGTLGLLVCYKNEYIELHDRPNHKQFLSAVIAGILVLMVWLIPYPEWMVGSDKANFLPFTEQKLSWSWVAIRLTGAALIVPLMEELFWRSFLMRRLVGLDFLKVNPEAVSISVLIISAIFFSLAHHLWVAAFFAGYVYGILYRFYRNLWIPIVAHATTNCLLGIWVVMTQNWSYW